MTLRVVNEPIGKLAEHAEVSIAYTVERILTVSTPGAGFGGIVLDEQPLDSPWARDYDAIKGEGPTRWAERFDVSRWGLIAALEDDERVGGAVVAVNTVDVQMLEGRSDLAVLWDLRVQPGFRSRRIGSALFQAAEKWSRDRGCRTLKVETQNVNVPACCFYVQMGCELGVINRRAYPLLPDETQLIWIKDL